MGISEEITRFSVYKGWTSSWTRVGLVLGGDENGGSERKSLRGSQV